MAEAASRGNGGEQECLKAIAEDFKSHTLPNLLDLFCITDCFSMFHFELYATSCTGSLLWWSCCFEFILLTNFLISSQAKTP